MHIPSLDKRGKRLQYIYMETLMIWFGRTEKAKAEILNGHRLCLIRSNEDDVVIDLNQTTSITFVQIGEDSAPVFEGWWMIGTPAGAIVASDECFGLDSILRDGKVPAIEGVADKSILFLASRPSVMRGRAARDGVVRLDPTAATSLYAEGTVEAVGQITDMPVVA
ncbi:hypothetical protein GCM10022268_36330 [Sphingomonas cynarae]|uniref:Uncharacterized protein n=2 Tax=Sphingomonas cynarae TaxID=930197 RepID=A0ABP7EVL5_9SPHN